MKTASQLANARGLLVNLTLIFTIVFALLSRVEAPEGDNSEVRAPRCCLAAGT